MKRLVVFSHKLFRHTPEGLQTTGGFTVQMDALAPYFEQVTLCVPITEDNRFLGIGVTAPNISFHPMPYFQSRLDFIRVAPAIRYEILLAIKQSDLALTILPSYVGVLASALCQRQRFPIFQWVVGNWGENVILQRKNPLTHWIASNGITPLLDCLIKSLTRDVLTFYNGKVLFDQGKPYHYTRTSSSIRHNDIYSRESTAFDSPPYFLLYVGRLSPEKGLRHLLDAVARLTIADGDIKLSIIGDGVLKSALQQQARDLSLVDRVIFHGFVPHGEALWALYRQSDVLIVPSLHDQTPKVILEGLSQSLPVIATNVGGISSIIKDGENGVLISPGQPEAIVEAVRTLFSEPKLRERLIKAGVEFARQHTVEHETELMMDILKGYFNFE